MVVSHISSTSISTVKAMYANLLASLTKLQIDQYSQLGQDYLAST